jgi:hypothetical protein
MRRIEPALEPDLAIVDPHHHRWDLPVRLQRYFVDEFRQDLASGHNVVSTAFIECHAMYRPSGAEAMRAVGEVEFANGQPAISASRIPARPALPTASSASHRSGWVPPSRRCCRRWCA